MGSFLLKEPLETFIWHWSCPEDKAQHLNITLEAPPPKFLVLELKYMTSTFSGNKFRPLLLTQCPIIHLLLHSPFHPISSSLIISSNIKFPCSWEAVRPNKSHASEIQWKDGLTLDSAIWQGGVEKMKKEMHVLCKSYTLKLILEFVSCLLGTLRWGLIPWVPR